MPLPAFPLGAQFLLADYSHVNTLVLRYLSVNFGAGKILEEANWREQIELRVDDNLFVEHADASGDAANVFLRGPVLGDHAVALPRLYPTDLGFGVQG